MCPQWFHTHKLAYCQISPVSGIVPFLAKHTVVNVPYSSRQPTFTLASAVLCRLRAWCHRPQSKLSPWNCLSILAHGNKMFGCVYVFRSLSAHRAMILAPSDPELILWLLVPGHPVELPGRQIDPSRTITRKTLSSCTSGGTAWAAHRSTANHNKQDSSRLCSKWNSNSQLSD
jgi:hypothetical protein